MKYNLNMALTHHPSSARIQRFLPIISLLQWKDRCWPMQWPDKATWLVDGISTVKWTTPKGEGESAFAGEATVPSSPSLLLSYNSKKMPLPLLPLFSTLGSFPRKKTPFLLGIAPIGKRAGLPKLILTLFQKWKRRPNCSENLFWHISKSEKIANIAWGGVGQCPKDRFLGRLPFLKIPKKSNSALTIWSSLQAKISLSNFNN